MSQLKVWQNGASNLSQSYSLMPNPNDGYMQLLQQLKDDRPVHLEVYNALGAVVYSSDKLFEGNKASLDLSEVVPGIYNIVLHDSNGDSFKIKFVKR